MCSKGGEKGTHTSLSSRAQSLDRVVHVSLLVLFFALLNIFSILSIVSISALQLPLLPVYPCFKLLHKCDNSTTTTTQQQRKQRKQAYISISRQTDHYLFPFHSLVFVVIYRTHKPDRQPTLPDTEGSLKIYFHTPQSQNALFFPFPFCPAGALELFFFFFFLCMSFTFCLYCT
jgi:hypothetical protein